MPKVELSTDGNQAVLHLETHFGKHCRIDCHKEDHHTFRLSRTAVNEVLQLNGVFYCWHKEQPDHAFFENEMGFAGEGLVLGDNTFEPGDAVTITEYYPLDVDGNHPEWLVTRSPFRDPELLYVNVDCLDGGGNIIKRYRVSPFTGEHVIKDNV